MNQLVELLQQHSFANILPPEFQHGKRYIFDLSSEHSDFIGINDLPSMIHHTQVLMSQHNAIVGIGRYGEKRRLYEDKVLFNEGHEARNIHLGLDITAPIGTPIHAPMDGIVHSFANNQKAGDYGPTIILQHTIEDHTFYTLYGHLNEASLDNLLVNALIKMGEPFAAIGHSKENGGWPPHLHLQIIHHIGAHQGDYPGVCSETEQDHFLNNCPDPSVILG